MAKNYAAVLKAASAKIKPSSEDQRALLSLSKRVLSMANGMARKYGGQAILAGSITRNTWLPDKREFDVFVLFPEKMTKKQLEENGLRIGKAVIGKLKGEAKVDYAEHPYVTGLIGSISVDIVPCYKVASAEQIKSAVDRTPFHVQYIEKHLPQKLAPEVRLLKQFLKSNGMYGADAKTGGYSGYVCELLVIAYGSFLDVLRAATDWQVSQLIDIEKVYQKQDYPKVLGNFKSQALVLIDPTDRNRNTAAALSAYDFYKFKKCAKLFLDYPSEEMFFPKKMLPLTKQEMMQLQEQRVTEIVVVKFIPPKVVPDILWPQLRKLGERLQGILEETQYEFKVFGKDVFTDEKFIAAVLLEMEVGKLPNVQKRVGPSVFDKKDVENFLGKYKDIASAVYVENNNWVVETKRQFLTAGEKLQDSLKQPLDILLAKGVPNHLAERVANGFDIISGDAIMQVAERNQDFGIFLRKYFEKEKLA